MVRLSDSDRQADRLWEALYRQVGSDGQSDGLIVGLMGGVTDRCVNNELTGCQMDGLYDGWMGITDGLTVSWTDSVTDRWVNGQTDAITD